MLLIKHSLASKLESRMMEIKVWDLFVRLFHWSLVAIMLHQYLFEEESATHNYLGYAALALVASRTAWGFVGSPYARFSEFVKSPATTLGYVRDIFRGHPKRYLGHNPAGTAMVLALLAMVAVTAASGWASTSEAYRSLRWVEELHEISANLTLILIFAHVAGVIVASLQHRENLVKAMFTGRKKAE
jgi:cytochrome b